MAVDGAVAVTVVVEVDTVGSSVIDSVAVSVAFGLEEGPGCRGDDL